MPITRSSLKTGPAVVLFDGATFYFKSGVKLTESIETFDITADTLGKADRRIKDRKVTISGVPAGEWESLPVLFPWVSANIGARLHGNTDKPLVIHALDGTRYTYHNAALSKMPSLRFAATETLLGEVEWTARVKDNTDPAAPNSLYTRDSAPFSAAAFDPALVLTQPYTLTWGSGVWAGFHTADGVTVDLNTSWQDLTVDGYGVLDQILSDIEITAKFKPLGIPQPDIDAKLKLQADALAALGSSLHARGEDLIIAGTGVHVILRAAAARSFGQEFGMGALRSGEMEAVATRSYTAAGVPLPLAYIGAAPPAE